MTDSFVPLFRDEMITKGKAMNNYRFNFKRRMLNGCSEYWLCEK